MRIKLLLLIVCGLFLSCSEPEPIKVGFIGSLSGRTADVSQEVRDGILLAMEQLNNQGGINGRLLELIVYDDQHDQAKVVEGVNFLADSGAVAIIGPVTSQMATAATAQANIRKIALLSPSASTEELTGKADFFFRTIATCGANARAMGKYAIDELNVRRVAILNDQSNRAFTDSWQDNFEQQVTLMGGEVITRIRYNSLEDEFSFLDLAQRALEQDPDGILILTNSIGTAIFCQQVDKLSDNKILMGSDWSFSGNLVQYGGKSVEGFTFTTNLDMNSTSPRFVQIKNMFHDRFRTTPKFPSFLSYEASQALFEALGKTTDPTSLAEALTSMGKVQGLQGSIMLDHFGDIRRSTYINQVRNGKSVSLYEAKAP